MARVSVVDIETGLDAAGFKTTKALKDLGVVSVGDMSGVARLRNVRTYLRLANGDPVYVLMDYEKYRAMRK